MEQHIAGFYLNNYPNLLNNKTFFIDCQVTQAECQLLHVMDLEIVNNCGVLTSYRGNANKNFYATSNLARNRYNSGYTNWNDGLNVYTFGTGIKNLEHLELEFSYFDKQYLGLMNKNKKEKMMWKCLSTNDKK